MDALSDNARVCIELLCTENYLDISSLETLATIQQIAPIVKWRLARLRHIYNKYARRFVDAFYLRVYKQTIDWRPLMRSCVAYENAQGTTIMPHSCARLHVVRDIGIFSDIPFAATIKIMLLFNDISIYINTIIQNDDWLDRGRDCEYPYFVKMGLKTQANPLPYTDGIFILPYEKTILHRHGTDNCTPAFIKYVLFGGSYRGDPHELEIYTECLFQYTTKRIVRAFKPGEPVDHHMYGFHPYELFHQFVNIAIPPMGHQPAAADLDIDEHADPEIDEHALNLFFDIFDA